MAGYCHDYSMSNNAYAAYQDNIRPYSRWGKQDILDALPAGVVEEYGLQKYPLWFLKEALLQQESWHHTGKMYNRTNFWEVVAPECSVNEFSRLYAACLLDGNYIDVIETYDRAPRGTGEVFRKILGRVK